MHAQLPRRTGLAARTSDWRGDAVREEEQACLLEVASVEIRRTSRGSDTSRRLRRAPSRTNCRAAPGRCVCCCLESAARNRTALRKTAEARWCAGENRVGLAATGTARPAPD